MLKRFFFSKRFVLCIMGVLLGGGAYMFYANAKEDEFARAVATFMQRVEYAQSLLDDTPVSVDGKDVPQDTYWVRPDDNAALGEALNNVRSLFDDIDLGSQKFYGYYYIADDKYRRDSRPVSKICGCHCCKNYSRAYLRHLAAVGDSLAHRLATMHNLRFYTMLMELLRS